MADVVDRLGEDVSEREEEEGSEWRKDGHSARDRRRYINAARKEKNGSNSSTKPPTHQKRCHKVIHNLPNSVCLDDIKEYIKHITGDEPLIADQLPCKIKGRSAFRVTCLYEHNNKLTGDKFGNNVKVSRYNYLRDFPVGALRELPKPLGSSAQPEELPHGPPTNTPRPLQSGVTELLRDIRHHS